MSILLSAANALAAGTDQAVMMLAHRWSIHIAQHFLRLRAEAGAFFPTYLAYSLSHDDEPLPEGCEPDIVVRPSDGAAVLPCRAAYAARQGIWTGSSDRFSFPALLGPMRRFDHVWFVEYDVDYAGNWGDFFGDVRSMPGDYVATHIRTRADDPDWPHWGSLSVPEPMDPARHLASFHPIARFSRRLIDEHVRAVEVEGWTGHTEAIFPTLAMARGLSVVDLGGRGRFVPDGWAERHYHPPSRPDVLSTRFGYRPPAAHRYFHQEPEHFNERGQLYHPVKLLDAAGPPDLLLDDAPAPAAEASPKPKRSVVNRVGRELRRFGRRVGGRLT